ncbi:MAG: hypothetical protein H0X36_02065 [Sphingomonadaceae bacterium]|nr:hypothetical protein [Sphingomonadaceae bacterium]
MSATATLISQGARAPVPDLTILELGIAIVCTRRPTSTIEQIAAEIARWFGKDVTATHVEMPLKRLIARGEVADNRGSFGATETGHSRAEESARALVRLVFRDRYFFDVGKLLDVTLVKEDGDHAH